MSKSAADIAGVEIATHRSGDIVWIDWFSVPANQRRQGVGSAAYDEFERALPPDVALVRLFAADPGSGPSDDFWDAMGFDYVYTCDDDSPEMSYESSRHMWKGVNGHSTPPSISVRD